MWSPDWLPCVLTMAILTDKKAQTIRPNDNPLPHGGVPGLTLTPLKTKGRGKWRLRYVSPSTKKRRVMGLGSYPLVSIAEAGRKATEARDLIYKGIDPLEVKEIQEPTCPTFEEAALTLHSELIPGWKNSKHCDQWINTLRTYVFPLIGDRKVDELSPKHFADAMRKEWLNKPETMSRTKQRCHAVMAWAWAHGFVQANPLDVIDHLLPKQSKSKVHQPAMPWEMIPEFFKSSLKDYPRGEATRPLLQFLILTATRSSEARGARWEEIDFAKKIWTIPADRMKAKAIHRVPLSDYLIELINRQRGFHDDLIFPSPRGLVASDMTLTVFLRRENAESDVKGRVATAHGFRSSFRDWASIKGYRRDLAERALAHTVANKVEAAYHRTDLLEERRQMMNDWENFCLSD